MLHICRLDFRWPALRFDWKCKSSDAILPPVQKAVNVKKVEEIKQLDDETENSDVPKSPSKPQKRENKEAKKSAGGSLLDIGVWNPDVVDGNTQNGKYYYNLNSCI